MNIWPIFDNKYGQGVCILCLLLALAVVSDLSAAENEATSSDTGNTEQDKSLQNFVDGKMEPQVGNDLKIDKAKIFPAVWCADIEEKATQSSCWEAYRNGLDYYRFGLAHRERVLEWQHTSTQIILFVVLTLVAMGLYFAWVQFQAGTSQQTDTEIEISAEGIKVSSPVLGVIILTMSLAFFYLYLIYVYPIEEVL